MSKGWKVLRNAFLTGLLFIPGSISKAQDVPVAIDHFLGLHDDESSAAIDEKESQDALNVEINHSGTAIIKRPGFSRVASLLIATSAVSGSFTFADANGNRQDIVCHDRFCAKSTNGSAFVVFMSSAGTTGLPTRWSFVQVNGKMYAANDQRDTIWTYDGTTLAWPASIPKGAILELTKDRLVVSDVSSNPNRVYYSQQGTYTNFVTGLNSADPYYDDMGSAGDRVSALKYARGKLYIYKTTSITACLLGDQYSSRCYPVSGVVGTLDPLSVVEVPDGLYFRGNDRHYWKLDDSGITLLSRNITNLVLSQTQGSQQSNTQTSQADWQAGTQVPSGSWDTGTTAGSIFPSSFTLVDASSDNFALGTITGLHINQTGSIQISSSSIWENFSSATYPKDGSPFSILTGGPMDWNVVNASARLKQMPTGALFGMGAWNHQANFEVATTNGIAMSTGAINFDLAWRGFNPGTAEYCSNNPPSDDFCAEIRFLEVDSNNFYGLKMTDVAPYNSYNKMFAFRKVVNGTPSLLVQNIVNISPVATHHFSIVRNADSSVSLTIDGVFISSFSDTTFTKATYFALSQTNTSDGDYGITIIGNINYAGFYSSGSFVSRIIDSGIPSPIGGIFQSTSTVVPTASDIAFYVRNSTSPHNDMWTSWAAASDTTHISLNYRYWQYESIFTTSISSQSPILDDVGLTGATTGQFQTQCIQPGSGITSWGAMTCAQSATGNASLTYYVSTGASCGSLGTWTAQANNATVAVDTAPAMKIRFDSLLTSATEQAQVDACTLYWNQGSPAQPVWGVYESNKNSVYWTTSINNSAKNNRLLKLDLNYNEWFPMDIQAAAPEIVAGAFYFGSSNGGYWNRYGPDGSIFSDNGASINSYWKSKDYGGSDPFLEKNLNQISVLTKNQITGSMTITYETSNHVSGSYNVSLSTTSGAAYVRANYNLPLLSPYQLFSVKFGNNSIYPWEVNGYRLDYKSMPWTPSNP